MDIKQHLNDHNVPTNRVLAIQHLNAESLSTIEYNERLSELGYDKVHADTHEAKYTYLYTVQNRLTASNDDPHAKAIHFIKNNRWNLDREVEKTTTIIDKTTGIIRKKKGWKKEAAINIATNIGLDNRQEIISKFITELDMTEQGAMTYFYITEEIIDPQRKIQRKKNRK